MRWDTRGTVAFLVSALVGVTAGVVVGLTTGSPDGARADNEPQPSATSTPDPDDPLHIGATLKNLDCTTEHILVVGWGEEGRLGGLYDAVSSNPEGQVKYLETAKSCNTLYGDAGQPTPEYVAYLGPYDSPFEPCQLQMTVGHANDVVSLLKPGVKTHVACLCALRINNENFPELTVGMKASTRDGIFVFALQRLLDDIKWNPDHHITGTYDEKTRKIIAELQELNAISVHPPGLVELKTWRMLRDRACLTYDF